MNNTNSRLGNLEESRKCFEQSIERARVDAEQEPQSENAISVTTNYNLGRIYEGLFMCDKAEKNYKDTLKGKRFKDSKSPLREDSTVCFALKSIPTMWIVT